jgi:hypothetical protein
MKINQIRESDPRMIIAYAMLVCVVIASSIGGWIILRLCM